jgi:[amino group carrier protein]-L-2-aminoadipate 6-kinase
MFPFVDRKGVTFMTLVVKIGGAAGVDANTTNIVRELAELIGQGERVVLLHGGSDLTNMLCERLGLPVRTITSPDGMTSRYTDEETLRVYAMAVAGQINTELVALLQSQGVNALGLSGVDGRVLVAQRKPAVRSLLPGGRIQIIRDDYTGRIVEVNATLLDQLLDLGYTPVLAPLALGTAGERLNVDGDRAAAAVAAALHVEALIILTNVPGLLANVDDPTTLLRKIPAHQLDDAFKFAQGRMRKKLLGAQEAISGGVVRVCIGNASLHALLNGAGTTIYGQETVPAAISSVDTGRS